MPRSAEDKKGIRSLTRAVLQHKELGPELVAKARQAKPGVPITGRSRDEKDNADSCLTRAQRLFAEEQVAKEHWKQLSREQQVAFSEERGDPTCLGVASSEPLPMLAFAYCASPVPLCLFYSYFSLLFFPLATWVARSSSAAVEPSAVVNDAAPVPSVAREVQSKRRGSTDTETNNPTQEVKKPRLRPLSEVHQKQLNRRLDACWEVIAGSDSAEDAMQLLTALGKKVEHKWPSTKGKLAASLQSGGTGNCAVSASDVLTGLSGLLPFQTLKLTVAAKSIQQHIDALVRQLCGSHEVALSLGYAIGRSRWHKAGQDFENVQAGGRPSAINNLDAIASVQAVLNKYSQPSSNIGKKGALARNMFNVFASPIFLNISGNPRQCFFVSPCLKMHYMWFSLRR